MIALPYLKPGTHSLTHSLTVTMRFSTSSSGSLFGRPVPFATIPPGGGRPPGAVRFGGNGGSCCFKATCLLMNAADGSVDGKVVGYDCNPITCMARVEEACTIRERASQRCSEVQLTVLPRSPRLCSGELYFFCTTTGETERL